MKNHYVSQLILKRFANALYIFDDNAKSISKHTQTENIFYKKDIYTDEVETAMNFNLENDFAKLLDKKVLGKNKITLTRTELLLLKRYLLVCSIKTKTPDEFIVSIRNFKSNTERYLKLLQHYDIQENNKVFRRSHNKDKSVYNNLFNDISFSAFQTTRKNYTYHTA